MARAWLETGQGAARKRLDLVGGHMTLGGPKSAFPIPGAGNDGLHLFDDPPKLVFVGSGERPRVNGAPVEEVELAAGDTLEWRGVTFVFGCQGGPARLEELTAPPAQPAATGASAPAWRKLKAGMLVELGLADKRVARRWQESVLRGEFDAALCTRELLAAGGDSFPDEDARLEERSTRLLRDLLMAPTQRGLRGTGRRVREAARWSLAALLTQFFVLAIYSAILFAALFLVRVRWGTSIDEFLDGIARLF
jgi:hypothetical protein